MYYCSYCNCNIIYTEPPGRLLYKYVATCMSVGMSSVHCKLYWLCSTESILNCNLGRRRSRKYATYAMLILPGFSAIVIVQYSDVGSENRADLQLSELGLVIGQCFVPPHGGAIYVYVGL